MTQEQSITSTGTTLSSDTGRRDYAFNHDKIRLAFFEFVAEHNMLPSNSHLAKVTGLSEKTVRNHFREFDLSEITDKAKPFADSVLFSLTNRALKRTDPATVKLYFQLVFGWNEKTEKKNPYAEEDLTTLTEAEFNQRLCELFDDVDMDFLYCWRDFKMKRLDETGQRELYLKQHPEFAALLQN